MLRVQEKWQNIFDAAGRDSLAMRLPEWLSRCRWFAGKAKTLRSAVIADVVPLESDDPCADFQLILMQVDYVHDPPETYLAPVGFATGPHAARLREGHSPALITELQVTVGQETLTGVLYDAFGEEALGQLLLDMIGGQRAAQGRSGRIIGRPCANFHALRGSPADRLTVRALHAEQSNSTILYGDRLLMKLYRKLEPGTNPELEVSRFLTETARFSHSPGVAGSVDYHDDSGKIATVGMLQAFVPNQGDAWTFTLGHVRRFFDRALSVHGGAAPLLARVDELCADYRQSAALLGQRTAELHRALASAPDDPDFAPAPFSASDQLAIAHSLLDSARQAWHRLHGKLPELPAQVQRAARTLLAKEPELIDRVQRLAGQKLQGLSIRCHGDYHLGQVLVTGDDFMIIDFEGEPARPLCERRQKMSPLKDVAGMIRSFDYAAQSVLLNEIAGHVPHDVLPVMRRWAELWSRWAGENFLAAYLSQVQPAGFVAPGIVEVQSLLDVFLLEKAVYELAYELNNRPTWVQVPLGGLLRILATRD